MRHMDDAERIKQHALRSRKRRKFISKALFIAMCAAIIAIFGFLAWAIVTGE